MKKTILLMVMLLIMCSGCGSQGKPKDVDTSLNSYQTMHFNGVTLEGRIYTATNGEDTFYYENHQIKRNGDEAVIQDNTQPMCMAATKNKLLYINERNELVIVNLSNFECTNLEWVSPLNAVLTNGKYIFILDDEDKVYYAEVENMSDGKNYMLLRTYSEEQPIHDLYQKQIGSTLIAMNEQLDEYYFCISGNYAGWDQFTRCAQLFTFYSNERWFQLSYKGIMELRVNGEEKVMDYVKPRYLTEYWNYYQQENKLYALSRKNNFTRNDIFNPDLDEYEVLQKYLVTERIEVYDLEKFTAGILYETEDNWERIIGFDGEYIYLMDVKTYTIHKYNPETKEKEYWHDLPEQTSLVFEWCGDALFVYDEEDNCLEILE